MKRLLRIAKKIMIIIMQLFIAQKILEILGKKMLSEKVLLKKVFLSQKNNFLKEIKS